LEPSNQSDRPTKPVKRAAFSPPIVRGTRDDLQRPRTVNPQRRLGRGVSTEAEPRSRHFALDAGPERQPHPDVFTELEVGKHDRGILFVSTWVVVTVRQILRRT